MFNRPSDLPDKLLEDALTSAWQLDVDSVEYLPVGFGSHHWLATDADRRWFVTVDVVDSGPPGTMQPPDAVVRLQAALSTARLLHDLGLSFVVAPIATVDGAVLMPVGRRYVAAVYPYVDGSTHGWGSYPDSDVRRRTLSRIVALHTAPRAAHRHALTDRFEIPSRDALEDALADTSTAWDAGPFAEPTRQLLIRNSTRILNHIASYDRLIDGGAVPSDRFVVTHGEPHAANTIASSEGLMLVDWDTALLAPPERDLWWFARESVDLVTEYEQQTGTAILSEALELYRLRWDLTDLALFTAQMREPHDDTEDTRTAWTALNTILVAHQP